jgi:hypothetical protein
MPNGVGAGESLFQRFRRSFSKWLETGQLSKLTQILVGVFLFIAGIGFQSLFACPKSWSFPLSPRTVFVPPPCRVLEPGLSEHLTCL